MPTLNCTLYSCQLWAKQQRRETLGVNYIDSRPHLWCVVRRCGATPSADGLACSSSPVPLTSLLSLWKQLAVVLLFFSRSKLRWTQCGVHNGGSISEWKELPSASSESGRSSSGVALRPSASAQSLLCRWTLCVENTTSTSCVWRRRQPPGGWVDLLLKYKYWSDQRRAAAFVSSQKIEHTVLYCVFSYHDHFLWATYWNLLRRDTPIGLRRSHCGCVP